MPSEMEIGMGAIALLLVMILIVLYKIQNQIHELLQELYWWHRNQPDLQRMLMYILKELEANRPSQRS